MVVTLGCSASTGPLIEISGKPQPQLTRPRGSAVRASTGPLIEISGKVAGGLHQAPQGVRPASTGPLIEISGKQVFHLLWSGGSLALQRGR